MPFAQSDEPSQKPPKRTGVWSVDTVKQKASADGSRKPFSRKGNAEISLTGEEEDACIQIPTNSRVVSDMSSSRSNWNSLKLLAMDSVKDVNIATLLNEFDDANNVKEDDSPWTKDHLFAVITNKLDEDVSLI